MKKYVIFTGIAICVPVIFSLQARAVTKKTTTPQEIKSSIVSVPDWSKTKSPAKLKYYDRLYNASK